MKGEETLQSSGFVQLRQVLTVNAGDEGAIEEPFRVGAPAVTDHHLDGGEAAFACGSKSAAAVDDNVSGVRLEVGFTFRVGPDTGVAVHDHDRLLVPVGLKAAGKIGEVSETRAGIGARS
ncbi:hypothetical protein ACFQ7G_25050 [Streptomyces massasporeus]